MIAVAIFGEQNRGQIGLLQLSSDRLNKTRTFTIRKFVIEDNQIR
jgi:hypothetical protein